MIVKTYQDLSLVIGAAAALRLCDAFGGTELRLPKSRSQHPELNLVSELIGEERLMQLIRYAGGDRLYIPLQSQRIRAERNRRIKELRDAGASTAEISRQFTFTSRLTQRQIYSILSHGESGPDDAVPSGGSNAQYHLGFVEVSA